MLAYQVLSLVLSAVEVTLLIGAAVVIGLRGRGLPGCPLAVVGFVTLALGVVVSLLTPLVIQVADSVLDPPSSQALITFPYLVPRAIVVTGEVLLALGVIQMIRDVIAHRSAPWTGRT